MHDIRLYDNGNTAIIAGRHDTVAPHLSDALAAYKASSDSEAFNGDRFPPPPSPSLITSTICLRTLLSAAREGLVLRSSANWYVRQSTV